MIAQSNLEWVWSQLESGAEAPGWRGRAHGAERIIQRLDDQATFSRRQGEPWQEVPPVLFPS
ncbi:MAG TPA: hypothetical protein VFN88_10910 [Caulobacteraceae bacterium]|nr:hypothetical protein [Caulobacteraceae bacterium]